jgi:lipopolysaccharide transport protein LptA
VALAMLAGAAPTLAAADSASTLGSCGRINLDSENGGAKFPKGGSGTISLANVTITADGCDMEIKANNVSTTSLDMNDSSWTLDGNVRIRSDQQGSRLSSDKAVVQFRNNEILRITMTGDPAQFEQKRPDSKVVTRGHARQMVYEAAAGTVRLVDDAWVSDGSKEITTPQLVYDIRRAEIRSTGDSGDGSKGSSDRIRITIDPNASKDAKKNDDANPAGSPAPTGQNDAASGTSPPPAKP